MSHKSYVLCWRALELYQKSLSQALTFWREKGVDVRAYTTEESARSV